MKSSILITLRAVLIMMLCAATSIISPAQTTFNSLFSFAGPNGANPRAVNLVHAVYELIHAASHRCNVVSCAAAEHKLSYHGGFTRIFRSSISPQPAPLRDINSPS
jgi:hypothetical protein